MTKSTLVDSRPQCNFCEKEALYDGKTNMGPWANMCEEHMRVYGIGVGVGRGQKLIVAPFPCPHCGAMIEPEGQHDADGYYDACPACGEEIVLEELV